MAISLIKNKVVKQGEMPTALQNGLK